MAKRSGKVSVRSGIRRGGKKGPSNSGGKITVKGAPKGVRSAAGMGYR